MSEPNHAERAVDLFREGYNCAQAVFAAFCDVTGMDFQTALAPACFWRPACSTDMTIRQTRRQKQCTICAFRCWRPNFAANTGR